MEGCPSESPHLLKYCHQQMVPCHCRLLCCGHHQYHSVDFTNAFEKLNRIKSVCSSAFKDKARSLIVSNVESHMSSFFKETHHTSDCSIREYCSWIVYIYFIGGIIYICSKTEVRVLYVCIMTIFSVIFLESN